MPNPKINLGCRPCFLNVFCHIVPLYAQVFPEGSSQEQVFQEAVQDHVDDFVKGANVLLFAYGPTASGKTHTMEGPPTDPGVVPRTFERVFRLLGPRVREFSYLSSRTLPSTRQMITGRWRLQVINYGGIRDASSLSERFNEGTS